MMHMFTKQYWFTKKWVLYDMKPNVAKHFHWYPSNMKHSFGVHVLVFRITIYILIFKYVLQTFDKRKFVRQQFVGSRGGSWTYPTITHHSFLWDLKITWQLHFTKNVRKSYDFIRTNDVRKSHFIVVVEKSLLQVSYAHFSSNFCDQSFLIYKENHTCAEPQFLLKDLVMYSVYSKSCYICSKSCDVYSRSCYICLFKILWCMFKIFWCMFEIFWCMFEIFWCIFYNLVIYFQ